MNLLTKLDLFNLSKEEKELIKEGVFVPPSYINSFTTQQKDLNEIVSRISSSDVEDFYISVLVEDTTPLAQYESFSPAFKNKGKFAFVMKASNSNIEEFIKFKTSAKKFITISDSFIHTIGVGTIPASNKGDSTFISPKEVVQSLYAHIDENISIFFENVMASKYPFANKETLIPTYHCNFTEINSIVLSAHINIANMYVSTTDGMRIDYRKLQDVTRMSVDIMRKIHLGYKEHFFIPNGSMEDKLNNSPQIFLNIVGVEELMTNLNINSFGNIDTLKKIITVIQEQSWFENNKLGGKNKPFVLFNESKLKENKNLVSPVFASVTSMVSTPYTENYVGGAELASMITLQKDLQAIIDNNVMIRYDITKISESSFVSMLKTLCDKRIVSLVYSEVEPKQHEVSQPSSEKQKAKLPTTNEINLPTSAPHRPLREQDKAVCMPLPNVEDLGGKSIFAVVEEKTTVYYEEEPQFLEETNVIEVPYQKEEFDEEEPKPRYETLINEEEDIEDSQPVRKSTMSTYISKLEDDVWNVYVIENDKCIAILSSDGDATPKELISQYKSLKL